jgi:hypothetical protein
MVKIFLKLTFIVFCFNLVACGSKDDPESSEIEGLGSTSLFQSQLAKVGGYCSVANAKLSLGETSAYKGLCQKQIAYPTESLPKGSFILTSSQKICAVANSAVASVSRSQVNKEVYSALQALHSVKGNMALAKGKVSEKVHKILSSTLSYRNAYKRITEIEMLGMMLTCPKNFKTNFEKADGSLRKQSKGQKAATRRSEDF